MMPTLSQFLATLFALYYYIVKNDTFRPYCYIHHNRFLLPLESKKARRTVQAEQLSKVWAEIRKSRRQGESGPNGVVFKKEVFIWSPIQKMCRGAADILLAGKY